MLTEKKLQTMTWQPVSLDASCIPRGQTGKGVAPGCSPSIIVLSTYSDWQVLWAKGLAQPSKGVVKCAVTKSITSGNTGQHLQFVQSSILD